MPLPAFVSTPVLVASAIATVVAVAGMRATDLGPWYRELRKPSWQPPDWLFGPVWTLVYVTCVSSVAAAWPLLPPEARTQYLVAWGLNVTLNVLWSVLFFARRRPDLAFWEVGGLWGSIVVLLVLTSRVSSRAAWLVVPYLVWVSFAAYLNRVVVRLNAPFLSE